MTREVKHMKTESIVSAVVGTILKVLATIVVIYLIYRGASFCYDYGYRIFTEPAVSSGEGRTVTVEVTKDMSPTEIGKLFQNKGLVKDARLFALQYLCSEYRKDVKPGVFELSTAMTAEEMMQAMTETTAETGTGTEESGAATTTDLSGVDTSQISDDIAGSEE